MLCWKYSLVSSHTTSCNILPFLNCLRIATILTSERSTDGVSRLLSKADLERLKLEKAKPLAKVAECLGLDFFLASHWVQNLQAKWFFFNGNNDCITEGVVARLVGDDEKDLWRSQPLRRFWPFVLSGLSLPDKQATVLPRQCGIPVLDRNCSYLHQGVERWSSCCSTIGTSCGTFCRCPDSFRDRKGIAAESAPEDGGNAPWLSWLSLSSKQNV